MNKVKLPVILLFFASFILPTGPLHNAFGQDGTPKKYAQNINNNETEGIQLRELRLNETIEQGLRRNHDQHLRHYEGGLLDIEWKDTYSSFWFPQVNIVMNSQEVIGKLRSKGESTSGIPGSPNGSVGLEFGEYTIFNWGKGYLEYQNARNSYKRNRDILKEKRRELKLDLIAEFFNLLYLKKTEQIQRDQLRHASFVYRINREKFTLKKIRKQEFLQSRDEYLRAQSEYNDARANVQLGDENMAYLINDPGNISYNIKQDWIYKKIFITAQEAIRISTQRNPDVLNSVTSLDNAGRSYDITMKDDLPLPKITVNLGTYKHTFGKGINRTRYETTPGNSNIEVVATINASWALNGEGGLFNSRSRKHALITKNRAIRNHFKQKHLVSSSIREIFKNIINLQNNIEIIEARVKSLEKLFDTILDNYIKNKTSFINLSDVLKKMTYSKNDLVLTKLKHIDYKIKMAKVIGVENLPNDIFEQLVKE